MKNTPSIQSHYDKTCLFFTVRKSGLYNLIQERITWIEYKTNHVNTCLKVILNPYKCASIYLSLKKT